MCGSLFLALPVTVVGHFFTRDFNEHMEKKKAEELAQLERFVQQQLIKQQQQREKEVARRRLLRTTSARSRRNNDR
jgi:hypothetical protein